MAALSMKEMQDAHKKLAQELADLEDKLHAKRMSEAEVEFERIYGELEGLKDYLSRAHKNSIVRLMEDKGSRTTRATGTSERVTVQPKFDINGVTWAGRGRIPKVYEEWEKSAEGKAWRKQNPKQRYPFHKDYTPTAEDKNWEPKTQE